MNFLFGNRAFCRPPANGESQQAKVHAVEDEGDGEGREQQLARSGTGIEEGEAEEAEAEGRVALRANVARFAVHADFEKQQSEARPGKRDRVGADLAVHQQNNE